MKKYLLFLLVSGVYLSVYSQTPDTLLRPGTTSLPEETLKVMPFRNSGSTILAAPNTYYLKGEKYHLDGLQTEGNYIFVDGMQVLNGQRLPYHSVRELNYYRNNQPVSFGNIPGAAVDITTRSFNDKLHVEGDVLTDLEKEYNNQLYEILIGGPVSFKKKDKRGWKQRPSFLISGSFNTTNDYSPGSEEKYIAQPEYQQYINTNPLVPSGMSTITYMTSEFTRPDDIQQVSIHQNAARKMQNVFAKLEMPIHNNMKLSMGSYFMNDYGDEFDFRNALFNNKNNLYTSYRSFDNYLSFNHTFIDNENLKAGYNLLFQYSNLFFKRENEAFKEDWIKYGYLGKFTTYKTPTFETGSIEIDGQIYDNVQILSSWDYDTAFTFQNIGYNPETGRFNEVIYELFGEDEISNTTDLLSSGGRLNGQYPESVYGLWSSQGTLYNEPLGQVNRDKYRVAFQMNFNFAKHNIKTGFEYSKRVERQYSIKPASLWIAFRSFTNLHILEIDKSNPYIVNDTVYFPRLYQENVQFTFDVNLRKKLGLPVDGTDFILIDSYDMNNNTISYYDKNGNLRTIGTPDELFSLDMFAPRDLGELGIVEHKGFSFDGKNRYNSNDPYAYYKNGNMNPFTPVYSGVFVEDEFSYGGFSARVGMRMDYYNANQPVMKDKYLLYEAYTKGEVTEISGNPVSHPSNIGDDFVVYVDDARNPSAVTGYRDKDTWYNRYGEPIDDPHKYLDAGAGVSPYLKDPNIELLHGNSWHPDMTFTGNKPVFNFLPQINLNYSFWRMNVYANFNSSTSNPYYAHIFMPDDYLKYVVQRTDFINNSAIEPFRIYKLNAGANFKIWKDIYSDLSVQQMNVAGYFINKKIKGAYPYDYYTVANKDENIKINSITASVMLFPGATGLTGNLSATQSFIDSLDRSIINIPYFVANLNINYNFGYGAGFRFPGHTTLKNIFEGFNAGLYFQYRNGTYLPDIYKQNYKQIRNFNYSPDFSFVNLRVEKGFYIKSAGVYLGAYVYVENLFNRENLFFVNPNTGKPDDDGYLTDPAFQDQIENSTDPDSYRYLYRLSEKNPNYYDKPRIVRLGMIVKI